MANFNKVILLGNLTRDVELRHTQSGQAIGKFGLAINRKWKSESGEMKETTCFVDCTAWGRSAEVLNQYVRKGSPLFVEGRLEYSTWEDKNGGGKRSKLDVTVEGFQLLGSGRSGASGGDAAGEGAPRRSSSTAKPAGAGGEGQATGEVDYGDIPF